MAPPVSEDQLAKWDPEQQAELEREALPETNCVWYMSRSPGHRHLVRGHTKMPSEANLTILNILRFPIFVVKFEWFITYGKST